jgi:hypothetical protein
MGAAVVLLLFSIVALISAWLCYDDDESRFGFLLCSTALALGSIACSLYERWQMGTL